MTSEACSVNIITNKQCRDVKVKCFLCACLDRPFKEFDGIEELKLEEAVTEGAAAFTKVVITGLYLITHENKVISKFLHPFICPNMFTLFPYPIIPPMQCNCLIQHFLDLVNQMSFYTLQRYIACFEFVRAIVALAEMSDERLAPIALDKMEEQVVLFNKLFRSEAYKIPEVYDHCELLDYDGKRLVRTAGL